jgi:hypothetical protein
MMETWYTCDNSFRTEGSLRFPNSTIISYWGASKGYIFIDSLLRDFILQTTHSFRNDRSNIVFILHKSITSKQS